MNDHKVRDYDTVVDANCGKEGTPERMVFGDEAYAFYTGSTIRDARKEENVTQAELADRVNSSKSYISRIEKSTVIPDVSMFYRIINALLLR